MIFWTCNELSAYLHLQHSYVNWDNTLHANLFSNDYVQIHCANTTVGCTVVHSISPSQGNCNHIHFSDTPFLEYYIINT